MGLAPNPVPLKAAMALLGRSNGEMRLPLTPLEPHATETLRGSLARYGLAT
jgi:4-hydroxy-tetrahydrodipicolinate synthase